jgi:hypothetical protein
MMTELNITFRIVIAEATVVQPLTIAAPENSLSRFFFLEDVYPCLPAGRFLGWLFLLLLSGVEGFPQKKVEKMASLILLSMRSIFIIPYFNMKKLFLTFVLSASLAMAWSQGPDIQWQTCLVQGIGSSTAASVDQTPDSGYIVAGSTSYSNNTPNLSGVNFNVAKLTKTGGVEWQKVYGGNNDDDAYSVIRTTDGGYIVAGATFSTPVSPPFSGDVTFNHGGKEGWIIKLSTLGVKQWQRSYGGSSHDEFDDIRQTADGGYIVTGYTQSHDGDVLNNPNPNSSYWVVKINSIGAIDWQKAIGGRYGRSIRTTTDGGYILTGTAAATDLNVTGNHGAFDYWVVKLNADGDISWQKSLGGSYTDNGYAVKQTADEGFIATGSSTNQSGSYFMWTVKLDNIGNTIWAYNLSGGSGQGNALDLVADGGYIVAGYSGSEIGNHGGADFFIAKTNAAGTFEWNKSMGGAQNDFARCVKSTLDGGYILAGETYSHNGDVTGASSAYYNTWVVKLAGGFCPVNTWTGYADLAWENPLNWSCGLPTSGSKVIINSGNIILSSSVSIYSIALSTSATLTLAPSGHLTVLH